MTNLIITAIIGGILAQTILFFWRPQKSHLKYLVMICVPLSLIGLYLAAFDSSLLTPIESPAEKPKPVDMDNPIEAAGFYISEERYDEAIALLLKTKKEKPDDQDIKLQLSTAYFAKGLHKAEQQEFIQSLAYLNKALKEAPKSTPFIGDIKVFIGIVEAEIANKAQNTENKPNKSQIMRRKGEKSRNATPKAF